jgi:hypothetical protein
MKRFVGWVFASVLVGLVLAGVISSKPWLEFTPRLTGEMMSQMSKEDEWGAPIRPDSLVSQLLWRLDVEVHPDRGGKIVQSEKKLH